MRDHFSHVLLSLLLAIAVAMPVRIAPGVCCSPGSGQGHADHSCCVPTQTGTEGSCCSPASDESSDREQSATECGDQTVPHSGRDTNDNDRSPCDGCDCPLCPGMSASSVYRVIAEYSAFDPATCAGTVFPSDERPASPAHISRLKRPPRSTTIAA